MRTFHFIALSCMLASAQLANAAKPGGPAAPTGRSTVAATFKSSATAPAKAHVKTIPLPYKAIPTQKMREAAKPNLMARQVKGLLPSGTRVSIANAKGSTMRLDVAAVRSDGRHYEKKARKTVFLPHVRYDHNQAHRRPDGTSTEKPVKGITRPASIQELRTARRFLQSQARRQTVATAQARAAPRSAGPRPMEIAARTRGRR